MSADTIAVDPNIISRLQLAKALKEDPDAEPPENSAIFLRQRDRTTKYGSSRSSFYIPRPTSLLVPPVLGNGEEISKDNNFAIPSSQPNILPSQQQEGRRPSQPQVYTSSPRNSVIIPEERRGSASKPATLLDVRQSMLEVRHNLQTSKPFSTTSSQRNSIILQNKSLHDANNKSHGTSKLNNVTNSRPNSIVSSSPRPISANTNNINSRPSSFYKSSNDDEDEESPKSKPKKSKEIKKSGSSSSNDSDSVPKLPPIKGVSNQAIILEKVEEEDDSSDEPEDEDGEEDDDDESSEDDTPLALKDTPKTIAPPKVATRKGSSSSGRIEAWLEHVSGSPPSRSSTPTHSPRPSTPTHSPRPSTPTHSPRSSTPTHSPTYSHSPTHMHSPRTRKTSEHSIYQYNSSPLSPHRTSHMAEPIYDARNRRPKSAFFPDNLQAPKPDFYQPRKRSNSEFVPKIRTNSAIYEQVPQFPIGRVSPSSRQDSGYWAKDTLIALSDDARHISLMNDSNSSHSSGSRGRSASYSGGSSNAKLSPTSKVINLHRREGSGNSVHSSKANIPQLHVQNNYSLPQIPVIQSSRSKDSLSVHSHSPSMNGNRNSLYNVQTRVSSEQLKANRNSTYSHQRVRERLISN